MMLSFHMSVRDVCRSRFKDTMVNTVGYRTAERALQLGLLYSPQDALKIGMVDELVPEEKLVGTATEAMARWFAIPGQRRGCHVIRQQPMSCFKVRNVNSKR